MILVVVDTLRADHLGAYGYPRDTSPELDRFAEEAILFERVVAPAPWTLPSVASMLTSTYPSVHGLRSREGGTSLTSMRDGLTTLAESFADAGYRTVAIGTNPWVNTEGHGLQRGFDEYHDLEDASARAVNTRVREVLGTGPPQDDPRPTFLYVHYMDVHGPYAHNARGVPDLGPIDERYVRTLTREEHRKIPKYLKPKPGRLDLYVAAYDRGIRLWDRQFGELLAWLAQAGRLDRAIVSVTSDHGEEFLEHGDWNHGLDVHDEQIKVPWILRVPGEGGRRVGALTSLIDVGPTLLARAGIAVPGSMAGVDVLEDPPDAGRAVLSETHIARNAVPRPDGGALVAMLRGDDKWIVEPRGTRCFDLARDPLEQQPTRCDPDGLEEVRRWLERLAEQAADLGDTGKFVPSPETRQRLRELGYAE